MKPWLATTVDVVASASAVVAVVLRTPQHHVSVWALAVALGGSLALRRWRPVVALVGTVVLGVVMVVVGCGNETVPFAVAWALYPVAAARPALPHAVGSVAAVCGAGVAVWAVPGLPLIPPRGGEESFATSPLSTLFFTAVVIVAAWAVAAALRVRRRQAAELAELRTGRAVAEERLRIARDIHDVVGHNLSLITMKAAVATHLAGTHPDEQGAALRTIEQVGRAALEDVRVVLGPLRDTAAPSLDRLVDDARAAGVEVVADLVDLARVPAAVRISAYRIAQEALTNVRRHSHPPTCRLTTALDGDRLVVSVEDAGTGPPGVGERGPAGHGLLGMGERAALHGGEVVAGPAPGGGFAVRATLPFGTRRAG
ncbi:sensor histidine kinase [Actinosynnema sp. NPDC050436]|uniref:sensor histidine kinase n=1 Tax=Actinosynnema sp. NPDC050436 TaxID=3155659 RepID=UPI0033E5C784